jgi:hypothetical protein
MFKVSPLHAAADDKASFRPAAALHASFLAESMAPAVSTRFVTNIVPQSTFYCFSPSKTILSRHFPNFFVSRCAVESKLGGRMINQENEMWRLSKRTWREEMRCAKEHSGNTACKQKEAGRGARAAQGLTG